MITGSNWQPGILKVLEGLGKDGVPIVRCLKGVLSRYDAFDPRRIGGAGKDLKGQIIEAVEKWEGVHGRVE